MPRSYAAQFRALVIEQVRSGRPVAEVAADLELVPSTVFRWVRQDRIDRGELAGTPTAESAELRAAKRRIVELEAELVTVKRASQLFDKGRVVRPKGVFGIVETLASEGHGAKRVCRILRVAPSGFFRWRSKPPSCRAIRRAWLCDVITEIHVGSRRTYGWRRIRAELADAYGQVVNNKLIMAIMAEKGISGLPRRRKPKPTPSKAATSQDLVQRDFRRHEPNQLWMTDITEHPTREGKLYCCVVLDAWSRRVVGWSLDRRPTAAMVNSALGMAIEARKPGAGALIHSDHGSQYTAWTFSQRVRAAGLAHSLGSIGDAFDNAVVESFWAGMQTELLNTRKWLTRTELSTEIFDWIEVFYTGRAGTAALGCLPPSPMRSSTPTTSAPPDSQEADPKSGGQIRWTTFRGPRHPSASRPSTTGRTLMNRYLAWSSTGSVIPGPRWHSARASTSKS